MILRYDRQADALYLRFDDSRIVESEELRPGVVFDYDEQNRIVAIEILDLGKRGIPDEALSRMEYEIAR